MPIITVQFIKDVVATPEQKRQLVIELTDKFVEILGDVVRPFVYCIIDETPVGEWAIAGVPMPDLVYLTGPEHAQVVERSNELMRAAIAQMALQQAQQADEIWRNGGSGGSSAASNGSSAPATAEAADAVWRGGSNASETEHQRFHREFFARWFDEMWNKKNYDYAYQIVDPNFTAHGAGGQDIRQGPEGVIGMIKAWHAAMPDGHMTMDDIITEGDMSAIRMTWEATHTGSFGEIPASGKRIKVTSTGIDRVVNGKITEGWGELDMLGMLQQMGAIPQPEN